MILLQSRGLQETLPLFSNMAVAGPRFFTQRYNRRNEIYKQRILTSPILLYYQAKVPSMTLAVTKGVASPALGLLADQAKIRYQRMVTFLTKPLHQETDDCIDR